MKLSKLFLISLFLAYITVTNVSALTADFEAPVTLYYGSTNVTSCNPINKPLGGDYVSMTPGAGIIGSYSLIATKGGDFSLTCGNGTTDKTAVAPLLVNPPATCSIFNNPSVPGAAPGNTTTYYTTSQGTGIGTAGSCANNTGTYTCDNGTKTPAETYFQYCCDLPKYLDNTTNPPTCARPPPNTCPTSDVQPGNCNYPVTQNISTNPPTIINVLTDSPGKTGSADLTCQSNSAWSASNATCGCTNGLDILSYGSCTCPTGTVQSTTNSSVCISANCPAWPGNGITTDETVTGVSPCAVTSDGKTISYSGNTLNLVSSGGANADGSVPAGKGYNIPLTAPAGYSGSYNFDCTTGGVWAFNSITCVKGDPPPSCVDPTKCLEKTVTVDVTVQPVCANGATNHPTCTCSASQIEYGGQCVPAQTCASLTAPNNKIPADITANATIPLADKTCPPSTPTNLYVGPSFCGNNWLNISWTPSAVVTGTTNAAPATSYDVYGYDINGVLIPGPILSMTNPSVSADGKIWTSFEGLAYNGYYSGYVIAKNIGGSSPKSSTQGSTVNRQCTITANVINSPENIGVVSPANVTWAQPKSAYTYVIQPNDGVIISSVIIDRNTSQQRFLNSLINSTNKNTINNYTFGIKTPVGQDDFAISPIGIISDRTIDVTFGNGALSLKEELVDKATTTCVIPVNDTTCKVRAVWNTTNITTAYLWDKNSLGPNQGELKYTANNTPTVSTVSAWGGTSGTVLELRSRIGVTPNVITGPVDPILATITIKPTCTEGSTWGTTNPLYPNGSCVPNKYTITPHVLTDQLSGTITPGISGVPQTYNYGTNQTYTISANSGRVITSINTKNVLTAPIIEKSLENNPSLFTVNSPGTINVTFASTTADNEVLKTYTNTYKKSVSYDFINIKDNHTISASFNTPGCMVATSTSYNRDATINTGQCCYGWYDWGGSSCVRRDTEVNSLLAIPRTGQGVTSVTTSWDIQYPTNTCTITATAVCKDDNHNNCTPAQIAEEVNLNNALLNSSTDSNDIYGANRPMTKALQATTTNPLWPTKALGKKTLQITNTTDLELNCDSGTPRKTRVLITTNNEG